MIGTMVGGKVLAFGIKSLVCPKCLCLH